MEELWGLETGLRAEPLPLAVDLLSSVFGGSNSALRDVMLFLHRGTTPSRDHSATNDQSPTYLLYALCAVGDLVDIMRSLIIRNSTANNVSLHTYATFKLGK